MDDAVKDCAERYQEALDACRDQRIQIDEDLRFTDVSNPEQWDWREKQDRENDPGGSRPCLTMDQLGQYIANVAGQTEQRPPSLHAIPVGSGADKKVAEKLDGFFRHIEYSSRAPGQHYPRVLTSAARAGVGYFVVKPEYTDRALNYQEPRIFSEGDPLRIVFDPWSVELDGSDATMGWHLHPFSKPEFLRTFGKDAVAQSFGDSELHHGSDDTRESIIVADEWHVDEETALCIVVRMPDGDQVSLSEDDVNLKQERGEPFEVVRTYKDKKRVVKWSRMSGAEVLTPEAIFPADGIGIVPCYGYVGYSNGRMTYCGIGRKGREPQRAYNYHQSEMRAYMNDAPKAPWVAPARAIGPFKDMWDRASVERRAALVWQDIDEQGPIQAPFRSPIATNLQNHVQAAEQALHDIQAALGMYQASLGAPSNESSGVAIESRKQQGEAATAHFPSHLAASLGQVGRLCMQMIPRLIDTKRQVRLLSIDNSASSVTIDPRQAEPVQEAEDGSLTINPNVGAYDVRIVVGASFSTQRQQAQQAYTEMMRANPQIMPAIAPLWAQTLDVPHADMLAQVLTAMAPPPVQAILNPDKQESTATLKAQNDQLKQALQEAIQHAKAAQQDADEAMQKLMAKEGESATEEEANEINWYKAETERLKVTGANDLQVQAIVQDLIAKMLQEGQQERMEPDESMGEQPTGMSAGDEQGAEQEPVEGHGPDGSAQHEGMEGEPPEAQDASPAMPQAPQDPSQMSDDDLLAGLQ